MCALGDNRAARTLSFQLRTRDVNESSQDGPSHDRRQPRQGGRTALATCLLVLGLLSFIGLAVHIQKNFAGDPRWHGNDPDPVGSALGLVWLVSSLLATLMSRSLRSPARELILVCGGMLTALCIVFWISVGVSE